MGGSNRQDMPQVPAVDPRMQNMADQQYQQAQDFESGAGGLKQAQGNMAQESSNQGLADQMSQINKGANSRGLLYSGLKQAAQGGAQGAAAAKLSQTQSDINQGVDAQTAALKAQAMGSQVGLQNVQNQRKAVAYNIASSTN